MNTAHINTALENLKGNLPESFLPLDMALLENIEANCTGKVASIVTDSYSDLYQAAAAGAIYWCKTDVTSKAQLSAILAGSELSQQASGFNTQLFFVADVNPQTGSLDQWKRVQVLELKDAELDTGNTKATLLTSEQGICISFEGHTDYGSEDHEGQPIYIERCQDEIVIYVWSDVNSEDPTHVISLENARNENRKQSS